MNANSAWNISSLSGLMKLKAQMDSNLSGKKEGDAQTKRKVK
eukprot:gene3167-3637_t